MHHHKIKIFISIMVAVFIAGVLMYKNQNRIAQENLANKKHINPETLARLKLIVLEKRHQSMLKRREALIRMKAVSGISYKEAEEFVDKAYPINPEPFVFKPRSQNR